MEFSILKTQGGDSAWKGCLDVESCRNIEVKHGERIDLSELVVVSTRTGFSANVDGHDFGSLE